ncbi:unnamed protein product, partial [Mesorhabditis spiculigera]
MPRRALAAYLLYSIPSIFLVLYLTFSVWRSNHTLYDGPGFTGQNFTNYEPHYQSEDQLPSVNDKNSSIALVYIVKNRKNEADYRIAVNSARCYAEVHNYGFIYVDYSASKELQLLCPQNDFFFTRHCLMRDLMYNSDYEFYVFLDADIGVINPRRRIEEFLPAKSSVNIVFYNRFYNDEIMAGSYILRKSKQAANFLQLWVEYMEKTNAIPQGGTDNGAIQSVAVEFFMPELSAFQKICEESWVISRDYNDLFRFEACMQYLISLVPKEELARRGFVLYDKGQGWSRDGWISGTYWCGRDLFFHGWKKQKLGGEWVLPFTSEAIFDRKCSLGEFDRWSYVSKLKISCLALDLRHHKYYLEKRAAYYKALETLVEHDRFPLEAYKKYGL